jgi:hypothetical protein
MNMRDFWANEAAAMRDTSGVLGKEVLKPVAAPDHGFRLGDPIKYYYNEQGLAIPVIEVLNAQKAYINVVEGLDKVGNLKISGGLKLPPGRPNQNDITVIRTTNGDFQLPPWSHRREIKGIIEDAQKRSPINGLLDYEMGGAGFLDPNDTSIHIHIRGEDGRGESQGGNERLGDYFAQPTEPFKGFKFPPSSPRIATYINRVYQFPVAYHHIRQGVRNNRIKEKYISYVWHSHPDADKPNAVWIQQPSPPDWNMINEFDEAKKGAIHFVISTKNNVVYFLDFKTLTTTNSIENDNYYGYSGRLPLRFFFNLPIPTL